MKVARKPFIYAGLAGIVGKNGVFGAYLRFRACLKKVNRRESAYLCGNRRFVGENTRLDGKSFLFLFFRFIRDCVEIKRSRAYPERKSPRAFRLRALREHYKIKCISFEKGFGKMECGLIRERLRARGEFLNVFPRLYFFGHGIFKVDF